MMIMFEKNNYFAIHFGTKASGLETTFISASNPAQMPLHCYGMTERRRSWTYYEPDVTACLACSEINEITVCTMKHI